MLNPKLQNTDCIEFIKTFPDKYFDVTFTSPPYNRKRNDKYEKYNDNVEDYFEWLVIVIDELLRVTKKHVIFNVQTNYYNRQDIYKLYGKYYNRIVEVIVWEKTNPLPASGLNITNAIEYFIVFGDEPLKSNKTYTKNILRTSVNSKMPKNHKAVMRQDVSDYFIGNFTSLGDKVLDPFLGMGTTGISCKKLGRDIYGSELVSDYYKEAVTNINNTLEIDLNK